MKTLLILLSLVSIGCAQYPSPTPTVLPKISTFNSHEVEWGWSGKDYSKSAVVAILEDNWGKVSPLDLQAKVDQVTHAEFLWKITPDLVDQAEKSGSSFIIGGTTVDSLDITLSPSGGGNIYLYSGKSLMGSVRCQSSARRKGKNSQLPPGDYKITGKEEVHISKEFEGAKMPKAMCVDLKKGTYIHCGDLSTTSGGCIRVSKPVGRELFQLIATGTPVTVTWKD